MTSAKCETTTSSAASLNEQSVLEVWGQTSLRGEVTISGAKNSALALMAGALLCSDDCLLHNVPNLVDIDRMGKILASFGVQLSRNGNDLAINARHLNNSTAPYELVSKLRASFFALGPLLARLGDVSIPLPGGCAIGARPVEYHVRGLQALGAEILIEGGAVQAHVKGRSGRLQGAKFHFDYPSVGATETIMMAATLAEGETELTNAAQEPEVVDLANFCMAMGAKIEGAGTNRILISGVERLHEVEYSVIPDRIEAGTFLVAGAITQSEITLSPVVPEHLAAAIAKLRAIGSQIIVEAPHRIRHIPGELNATDIETLPYPGFPTDMQAQFMALLTLCEGNCVVSETVFENRLQHVAELSRMGADIRVKGNHAIINGVPFLSGAPVMATDLRASAALVVAGLAAHGKTTVQNLHHLDRGYDNIEAKLRQLGARLERVTVPVEPKLETTASE